MKIEDFWGKDLHFKLHVFHDHSFNQLGQKKLFQQFILNAWRNLDENEWVSISCRSFFDRMKKFALHRVCLLFDREQASIAYGSVSGTLVWGENQCRACSSVITYIAFIGGDCVSAVSSASSVYIMKRGFAKPVDLFQPSLLRSGPTTKIAVFDISTD